MGKGVIELNPNGMVQKVVPRHCERERSNTD